MRGVVSLGYNRPEPRFVSCSSVSFKIGGELLNRDRTAVWDYNTPTSASVEFSIRLQDFLVSCGLSSEDAVGASLTWSASGTSLRGASETIRVEDGINNLDVLLDSHQLGGKLTIRPSIFLLERRSEPRNDASPTRPGSVLWSSSESLLLEGSGSRFPTVVLSFDEVGLLCGPHAAWYLDIADVDFATASAAGSVLLYINADHLGMMNMLNDPNSESAVLMSSALNQDIVRQLARRGMAQSGLSFDADFLEGSFAYFIQDVLKLCFPGLSVREIVAMYARDPGEFDARIQDSVRLFA